MNSNKKAKLVLIVSVSACFAALLAAVFILINLNLDSGKVKKQVSSLRETAVTRIEGDDKQTKIDFEALQKSNADIYAWISVPGTVIDYPIVQPYYEDDDFYLYRDLDKKSNINGSIYTEKHNSTDFTDPNTVIYGHNMLDGSMFAGLHSFADEKFFEKHKTIYIYTPTATLEYTIVSAYKSDDRHILNSYDFTDEEVFERYLKGVENPRSLMENHREMGLTVSDRIITLSTCIGNEKNYRYLVQGVLTNESPR